MSRKHLRRRDLPRLAHPHDGQTIVIGPSRAQTAGVPAKDCSAVLKALADRTRQRIVKALLTSDLSVNELTERLAIPQYNTSKHLGVLKKAGIVDVRADGSRHEYSISRTLRRRIAREGLTLDFGCCTFHMGQLPD